MTDGSAPSPLSDEIEQALAGITPGDWEYRKELRDWNECIHYMIQTVNKLPEHPHSQRFIAWMCGSLGETTRSHWIERQKQDMGWRDDPAIEADARLMAAAPRLLRSALARLRELEARNSRLEDAAFHFQTCATCAQDGEEHCVSGRQFAAFMRGEPDAD